MFRHRLTQFTTHLFSWAIVSGMLQSAASATEIITLRSGYDEASSTPYTVGAIDANIHFLSKVGGPPVKASAFTLADFQMAQSVGNSTVSSSASPLSDPKARWVDSSSTSSSRSALFGIPFNVSTTSILSATLSFEWRADDTLGDFFDPASGKTWPTTGGNYPNLPGVYIGQATTLGKNTIPMIYGGNPSPQNRTITGLVKPGLNYLYVYQRDTGLGSSGLIFSATIQVEPSQPLTVAGLRNFTVVSPGDVNDFHITLHGITNPLLVANGGSQIQSVFPASFNVPNPNPPGWYPPTITTILTPPPPRTIVSYGPGASLLASGTSIHFGVDLTLAGEAALEGICMNWTRDGAPIFVGGDPNLPITVIADQPAPGETSVQIVNQVCPDQLVVGPGRWIGPVYAAILDRHAELDELTAGSPIFDGADILRNGNTFLAGGEQLTLSNVDANSPVAAGKSIAVRYDVFEDDGGMPGRLIGTSYSAFNVSAVPEPSSFLVLLTGVLGAVAPIRRRAWNCTI